VNGSAAGRGAATSAAVLILTALVAACSSNEPGASEASASLAALGEVIWSFGLERDHTRLLREGLTVERLPPIGFTAAQEAVDFQAHILEQARVIDVDDLTHAEELTLRSVVWDAEMAVEGHQYFWLGSYLTPYSSPLPNLVRLFGTLPLEGPEDAAGYLALLRQTPAWIGELETLVRGQMERGFVVSHANLPAAIGLVRAMRQPATQGPFTPDTERVSGLEANQAEAFLTEVVSVVEADINPALDRLTRFLEGPYAARAPSGVGISQYPDGEEYYRYLTRLHSTMDVTPEEVQRVGYAMLDDFETRMAEIREEVGWEGTGDP